MYGLILVWIFILNISKTTLHNTMLVVDDEVVEVGTLRENEGCELEVERGDSVRVIFTLGQERGGWLGTDKLPLRNVIITDSTQTYEIILEDLEEIR